MVDKMRIAIAGCSGRMGKSLLAYGFEEEARGNCIIVGGTVNKNSEYIGKDLRTIAGLDGKSGILSSTNFSQDSLDAIIDFTTPECTKNISILCAERKIIHVCGTTGMDESQKLNLEECAKRYPLLYSANMSYGINIIMKLIRDVVSKLEPEKYDIDILERHHNKKIDAPSGTALMIAKEMASCRDANLSIYNPLSSGKQRNIGDIGISSIRSSNISGSHEVIFAGVDEIITLKHESLNRAAYSAGAFKACYWMKNKPYGRLYSMLDVINNS